MRSYGVNPQLARPSRTVEPAREAPPPSRNSSAAAPADDFNAQLAQAQQNASPAPDRAPATAPATSAAAAPRAAATAPDSRAAPPPANPPGTSRAATGRLATPAAGGASAAAAAPGADLDATAATDDSGSAAAATAVTLAAAGAAARAARRSGTALTAPPEAAAAADGAAATPISKPAATLSEARSGLPAAVPTVASTPENLAPAHSGTSSADADDGAPADPNAANAAQLLFMLPMLAATPAQPATAAASSGDSAGASTAAVTGAAGLPTNAVAGAPTLDGALLAGLAHTLAGLDTSLDAGGAGVRSADGDHASGAADGASGATKAVDASDGGTTLLTAADATLAAIQPAAGAASSPVHVHVQAAVGSAQWPEEVASHLLLMSSHGIQSAELRLTPADLGPVQVRIEVQDGAASVWFQASHPDTRSALENALPQLRHMLAGQGLTLTDAGVNREPPREAPTSRVATGTIHALEPVSAAPAAGAPRVGLIDAYA